MTNHIRLTGAAAALAGLLAAGAAAAQPAPPPDGPRGRIDFAAIDTNGDGSLGRDELTARATDAIGQSDADGDGSLERVELIAVMPARPRGLMQVFSVDPAEAMADRMLAMMGATDTGTIEIAALADRQVNGILAALDTDRDGAISKAEADAPPRRAGPRGKQHDRPRHGHHWF